MSINIPYMATPWTLPKILEKIKAAAVPENFNSDFLSTKLWFKWGTARAFISWAKKCNLLNSDWTPTQSYKDFRNPTFSWEAMGKSIKIWYKEIFDRNEYAESLERKDLTKLVTEITWLPHDNSTVRAIVWTFFSAKDFADFEKDQKSTSKVISNWNNGENETEETQDDQIKIKSNLKPKNLPQLGLSYTINLVLPKTDDPAVYNAIFKSLNDNLFNGN